MSQTTPTPEDDYDMSYWPPYEQPTAPLPPKNLAMLPDGGIAPARNPGESHSALNDTKPTPDPGARVAKTNGPIPNMATTAPRRAYGRSATTSATPPVYLPNSKDLDMFPAFMSRSALFCASRPNCGGQHAGALRAAGNTVLSFTGPRLSMTDKRVWEALVRVAKRDGVDVSQTFAPPLGEIAEMAGYASSQTRSAWAAMERLAASRMDARVGEVELAGMLLASACRNRGKATVRFDVAFAEASLSRVLQASMAGAAASVSSPLGQWLRDFFSTHEASSRPLSLGYLREMTGHVSAPKHFVVALERAMKELVAKTPDLITAWSLDKQKRGSFGWILRVKRGSAKPAVKHPPKTSAPSGSDSNPRRQIRLRGGVEL